VTQFTGTWTQVKENLMLADLFGPDLLIVAIILVVLLFGGAAIPKLARNLGSAKNQFEKGMEEGKAEGAAPSNGTSANGTSAATGAPAPTPTPPAEEKAPGA
jgi:Sec-independent protein translocase protein TatA